MSIISFFDGSLLWYLATHPSALLAITGSLLIVSAFMGKDGNRKLLYLYLAGIIYITILSRPGTSRRAIITPFWSYRYFMTEIYFRRMILNNIFLFVPLGMILTRIRPRWSTVLMPVLISTAIEISQYILRRGFFEFDDIISNSLGGLIGFLIGIIWILAVKAFRYLVKLLPISANMLKARSRSNNKEEKVRR